jgi:putative oxidoreductase
MEQSVPVRPTFHNIVPAQYVSRALAQAAGPAIKEKTMSTISDTGPSGVSEAGGPRNALRRTISGVWAPRVLSLLRVMAALLFIEHGLMKLVAFPAPQPGVPHPLPPILIAAALIEVVGGGLLAVGLFTRIAAFIAAGEMAAAYFMVHAPMGFWPALNKGEPAILFCSVFFYLAFAGGGSWSLDARWRRP